VCGCGADRGGWSSSGCGLVAGWCVCVVLGWWVCSRSRLLLLSHKAMCALQAAGREILVYFNLFLLYDIHTTIQKCLVYFNLFLLYDTHTILYVKHNEKTIGQQVMYPLYLTIFDYPTISHYIPSYSIISHHIPPYPPISKPGYPKDIRIRHRGGLARVSRRRRPLAYAYSLGSFQFFFKYSIYTYICMFIFIYIDIGGYPKDIRHRGGLAALVSRRRRPLAYAY